MNELLGEGWGTAGVPSNILGVGIDPLSSPTTGSPLSGRPDIQWTNLDPEQLLAELGPFASLEGFRELLDKAQVGRAYVGRPCLHPDDPHCPPSAPNHHSKQVGASQVCQRKAVFLPFPLLICSSILCFASHFLDTVTLPRLC